MALARISVLISGRGSNLGALIDASHDPSFHGAVTHVVSNRPGAGGLARAERQAIATSVVDHRAFASDPACLWNNARTVSMVSASSGRLSGR